jgi:hypothetical protein
MEDNFDEDARSNGYIGQERISGEETWRFLRARSLDLAKRDERSLFRCYSPETVFC